MCDATGGVLTALSIAMAGAGAQQQQNMANLKQQQMLEQSERANKILRENYMSSLTDMAMNQMEVEEEKNRMLDINALAGIEATAQASLQSGASGVTGNSMSLLLRDIDGSYGQEEALITRQYQSQQKAMERQKAATHRATRHGSVNPQIIKGGERTNMALKIGAAGLQGYGDWYSSNATLKKEKTPETLKAPKAATA